MCTVLEQLDGHPDVDILDPGHSGRKRTTHLGDTHFDCMIVGAGHSGLGNAGRLQALGVSCVVIDRNHCLGDNWSNRYDSAKREVILTRDSNHRAKCVNSAYHQKLVIPTV